MFLYWKCLGLYNARCKLLRVDVSVIQSHDFLHLRLVAVSCRQHPLAGDERSAAEVVAGVQGHLVGHRVLRALIASDHAVIRCSH